MRNFSSVIKTFMLVFTVLLVVLVIMEYKSLSNIEDGRNAGGNEFPEAVLPSVEAVRLADVENPVIVWWTPLTKEPGQSKNCGNRKCFFTVNRAYRYHKNAQAFLFYGTDLAYGDLPVPRQPHHDWGLLHEESPKNNYLLCHGEVLEIFNHTATFNRESDLPLTLQYLADVSELETGEYMVSTAEKNRALQEGRVSLVNYVQSDCGAPSDRDHFVRMLMKHLRVDSYGECEHNKNLPEHLRDPIPGMGHRDFYKLLAQYKFTITFENAVCNDYVTEKFWRPFKVGSVPIVFGSPRLKDLLPSNHSVIMVTDYRDVEQLVRHLRHLDTHDAEYERYLSFKKHGVQNDYLRSLLAQREWAPHGDLTKPNMIDAFECLVCDRLHGTRRPAARRRRTPAGLGCPAPRRFSDLPPGNLSLTGDTWWAADWTFSGCMAKSLRSYLDQGENFTAFDVQTRAHKIQQIEIR